MNNKWENISNLPVYNYDNEANAQYLVREKDTKQIHFAFGHIIDGDEVEQYNYVYINEELDVIDIEDLDLCFKIPEIMED